jgi:hypothetical protein
MKGKNIRYFYTKHEEGEGPESEEKKQLRPAKEKDLNAKWRKENFTF